MKKLTTLLALCVVGLMVSPKVQAAPQILGGELSICEHSGDRLHYFVFDDADLLQWEKLYTYADGEVLLENGEYRGRVSEEYEANFLFPVCSSDLGDFEFAARISDYNQIAGELYEVLDNHHDVIGAMWYDKDSGGTGRGLDIEQRYYMCKTPTTNEHIRIHNVGLWHSGLDWKDIDGANLATIDKFYLSRVRKHVRRFVDTTWEKFNNIPGNNCVEVDKADAINFVQSQQSHPWLQYTKVDPGFGVMEQFMK